MCPDMENESRPNGNLAVKAQVGSEFLIFLATSYKKGLGRKLTDLVTY